MRLDYYTGNQRITDGDIVPLDKKEQEKRREFRKGQVAVDGMLRCLYQDRKDTQPASAPKERPAKTEDWAVDAPLLAVANFVVVLMLVGLVFLLIRLKTGSAKDEPTHDQKMEDRGY
jgi:hypothetical protein